MTEREQWGERGERKSVCSCEKHTLYREREKRGEQG